MPPNASSVLTSSSLQHPKTKCVQTGAPCQWRDAWHNSALRHSNPTTGHNRLRNTSESGADLTCCDTCRKTVPQMPMMPFKSLAQLSVTCCQHACRQPPSLSLNTCLEKAASDAKARRHLAPLRQLFEATQVTRLTVKRTLSIVVTAFDNALPMHAAAASAVPAVITGNAGDFKDLLFADVPPAAMTDSLISARITLFASTFK